MNWIKHPLEPRHVRVPLGVSKMIFEPMVRSAQTMHLSCVNVSLYQINWIKHPLGLRHLGVLSGASKMIPEPMICLAQTMHLFWTDTNTISKWTKTKFHMTHVTLGFQRVRPKWFLRLWYVRHKSSTYLTSRLALFLNGLNQASTWASSPRSTIGCIQNDF
jgi:hypothetical protein